MLTNVFTKSIDDRWRGTLIGTVIIGLFLFAGLAAYSEIDTSVYTDLPESIRSLMNIPEGADVGALAFGVMYGLMGAMTLAGLALSMGASSIAGEERDGTIGLLLANPRSRARVLTSKVTAMVVIITLGSAVLFLAAAVAPDVIGVEMGSTSVFALVLHMWANALFFGFLAVAIGAWTGNRVLASGATAAVMVLSYVAVGLLPLVDAIASGVRAVPWYYFDGSQPLSNGVSIGHLAIQLGGAVLLSASAFVGVTRRDLRRSSDGVRNLLDRLRENPRTARLFERLAGRSRVSRVFTKTASENQIVLILTATVMFSMMGLLMGPMYLSIEDSIGSLSEDLPQGLIDFVGGGDLSTPEGFYQIETFGLMAPIAVMFVTILMGSRALAGEERRRTMGLLLANPISRNRIVMEKAAAMAVHATIVGAAIFAGVAGGSLLAGLEMSIASIGATSLLVTLLGMMFGALALAISAATGSVRSATVGAIGAAGALYVSNSLLNVAASLKGWSRISPFHWYLGHDPLVNGMHWGYGALFLAFIVTLVAIAVWFFEHRDLRNS